jgi:drug/metabolite transporter (DMT)-like permease
MDWNPADYRRRHARGPNTAGVFTAASPRRAIMKWLLVLIIVLCNTVGDLMNTLGMKKHGEINDFHLSHVRALVSSLIRNRYVIGGLVAMGISFFALLNLLSIANVSFAVPATAASYPVETLLAKYVLKEHVTKQRWAGCIMVALGVGLLAF